MATLTHVPTSPHLIRPTRVVVDLQVIATNYKAIQRYVGPQVGLMPTLKANAYGHGLIEIGRLVERLGAAYLVVAYLEEGLQLRKAGIRAPILVLGGLANAQIPLFIAHQLTLTASSVDKLQAIEEAAAALRTTARVHLTIDTGMERVGVHWYSAKTLLKASLRCKHVAVTGIYSHFANADAEDLTHAKRQLERFNEVLRFYERHALPMPSRHMANSSALVRLPDSHFEGVRPGLALYGVHTPAHLVSQLPVQQALSWRSRVVYFKVVKSNNPVGYGSTWAPPHNTRVVTVPVGYGDGYFRCLSSRAQVVIGNKRYPVRGNVTMDAIVVDIGSDSAYNGDEVILLGGPEPVAITAHDMADWAGTIPYEVFTNINARVPRVYLSYMPSDL